MKDDILNLTNLKYFCDAVKLGGVSASAQANFVTQSAISQGIGKLETMLGISLVAHHPKCFRITPAGEMVYKHSQDILYKASQLKEHLLQEEDRQLGSLEFACTYSFAVAVIPQQIKRFKSEHPDVKIHFRAGKNEIVKQMLKMGTIDFGILPDEGDLDPFEKRKIYEGYLKLYASRQIPARNRKKLNFILAEPFSKETILLVDSYRKRYGGEPKGVLEVNSWEIMVKLVEEGLGIGYLPDYITSGRKDKLVEVDLDLELHRYDLCAIYPVGMQLRKSSQVFLSYF